MSLDVYHQILAKLYEVTRGSDKKIINLVDLIKKEGFGGAVDDICDFMNREGWVAEATGQGAVRITPWGVEEAQRSGDESQSRDREVLLDAVHKARQTAEKASEFVALFEEYANCQSKPDMKDRVGELYLSAMNKLKSLKDAVESSEKWFQKD